MLRRADLATREEQIAIAEVTRARQGWGAWPDVQREDWGVADHSTTRADRDTTPGERD